MTSFKNGGICSAIFSQSQKGVVFQEPWKPGMASGAPGWIHAFLEMELLSGE